MSIPDWLNYVKDGFKDAAAYSMVAEQVSMLEERIRMREDKIGQLLGQIADLESQNKRHRRDLTAISKKSSALEKQVQKFQEAEQYDIADGIAFKRTPEGSFEESPRCPQCFSYLSSNEKSKFTYALMCKNCSYTPHPQSSARNALKKINKAT